MADTDNVVQLADRLPAPKPFWSDEETAATVALVTSAIYWLREVFADGQPRRGTDVVNAWLEQCGDYGSISAARNALGLESVAAKGGRIWVCPR